MNLTGYQKFVVAVLAFLQFTIVLDFMILSPLGALLLQELHISTGQFGLVVSVYAFSAGISGILAAGFSDKFDRKNLLMFFYSGFIVGTFLCGIANSYIMLLLARMVTGLFGGVIGSISFAIIADLFPFETRGRVMGFVQTAFAATQVLGIPVGLYASNHFGWHAPFLMIVGVGSAVWVLVLVRLRPIRAHLEVRSNTHPVRHLIATVTRPRYLEAFAATILLATGGFMLLPFGSAFSVNNLGISLEQLPMVYMVTGVASMISGPIFGRLSDSIGKYKMFAACTLFVPVIIIYYCHLGITPLWLVIVLNVLLYMAIMARVVSAQALVSGVPDMKDRGAFMAVNSSLQQLSGGVAASVAGMIVIQTPSGKLENYGILSYVVTAAMLITIVLMYRVNATLAANTPAAGVPAPVR